ncbi:MAG: trypsin-like peptidase domain-containing protein, partial [Gammaproteobacteria bacterium]|nr:trypsin-like peptidase domain-containing protein [Gammaproteobacteria bacterium]
MAVIRANRESIDNRFSVLGFTVRTEHPLFEIGLATDPELLKAENRSQRNAGNFFSSSLLGANTRRGEAVYLVPPSVVSRFVGQPRLYFGLATYLEGNRSQPASVKTPDRGNMYVNLSGLTERGLRRTARVNGAASYGNGNGHALTWGGDALASASPSASNGSGNGAPQVAAPNGGPAPYSDGYSDDLWQQPASSTPNPSAPTSAVPTADAAAATAQGLRKGNGSGAYSSYGSDNGYGSAASRPQPKRAPSARELRVVSSYYNPSDWLDALRTQIGFFAASVQWWAGVEDTTVAPHSAICQARTVDGSAEGGQHGSAFFIAPNLLLTAAHVVDGQSELIIVPGKNGAGTGGANEPFGRFRVSASDMVKHPSYVASSRDFDMALIRVPAANTSPNYFELVEELTQSRPEGVVVSGYAAWSDPQGLIDSVVNATIDADKQHMHGGYIRSLPSDETFDYDLQSLGGTSGSPVYYIENGDAPRTHMVGVHVASQSDTTNLGCRITPAKLAWIRQQAAAWSQSLSFSLGARQARAFDAEAGADIDASTSHDDVEQYSHVPEPVEDEFASEQSYRARVDALT